MRNPFQHSQLGVYLVSSCCLAGLVVDSYETVISQYHGVSRRWWLFIAGLLFFTYVYVRPYIRIGLGSASRAHINFTSCYLVWLCGSVCYHLPSLKTMGIDVRADVSLFIVTFTSSLAALSVLWLLHAGAIRLGLLHTGGSAVPPGTKARQVLSVLLLNSGVLALACSSYHSICGNGLVGVDIDITSSKPGAVLRSAICINWLHPVPTHQYPSFSAWMLYGEGTATAVGAVPENASSTLTHATTSSTLAGMLLEADGNSNATASAAAAAESAHGSPADSVLSPVLTMWITIVCVYIANSIADYAAAQSLHAAHMGELRQEVQGATTTIRSMWRRYGPRQTLKERRDAGNNASSNGRDTSSSGARSKSGRSRALDLRKTISKTPQTITAAAAAWGTRVVRSSSVVQTLVRDTGWLGSQAFGLWDKMVDTCTGASWSQENASSQGTTSNWPSNPLGGPSFSSWGTGLSTHDRSFSSSGQPAVTNSAKAGQTAASRPAGEEPTKPEAQPEFLPMVPWYSGTSADLLKTCFDLMVSVKLFLGRFDMRTMQAATAASMADTFNEVPYEGDGFTYEQYEEQNELWLDFVADTGDGGNPTYTVARACATPQLSVQVPAGLMGQLAETAHVKPTPVENKKQQSQANKPCATDTASKAVSKPAGLSNGKAAPGSNTKPLTAGAGSPAREQQSSGSSQPGVLSLPRPAVLLLGGDLAYPNPTKETYEQRLLRPFQDALPPPLHYHPERLVVHKPDLPPVYGVQEAALPGGLRGLSPRASRHAAAAALRAYNGPTCFAIPGNHDWVDGLETYINYILHKGWLGGWLLPQEKSYFALKLPHGWWLFGLDLALTHDIDMCQLRYFANVVEQRVAPEDNVIIMTHQPVWLLEWFWRESCSPHMRQLIRGHLRGRARVHLAGDLHFYMRHSFVNPTGTQAQEPKPSTSALPSSSHKMGTSEAGIHAVNNPPSALRPTEATSASQALNNVHVDKANIDMLASTQHPADKPVSGPTINADSCIHSSLTACSSVCSDGADTTPPIPLPISASQTLAPPIPDPLALTAQSGRVSVSGLPADPPRFQHSRPPASGSSPAGTVQATNRVHVPSNATSWQPDFGHRSSSQGIALGATAHNSNTHFNAYPTRPSSIVGGSSDDESESGFSTTSARSWQRRISRDRVQAGKPKGLRAFGKQLPTISVNDLELKSTHHPAAGGGPGGLHRGLLGSVPENLQSLAGFCEACQARAKELHHHTFDPEHLICNGAGGAFLHPTHVFAPAAFRPPADPAAEATAALYSNATMPCTCRVYPHNWAANWGAGESGFNNNWASIYKPSASTNTLNPLQSLHTSGPATASKGSSQAAANNPGGPAQVATGQPGLYTCHVAYPSPERSLELGRKNLHLFRSKNTRFDVIGGMFYFLMVVSIMPRCSTPGPLGQALLSAALPLGCSSPASNMTSTMAANDLSTYSGNTTGSQLDCKDIMSGGVAAILDAETYPQLFLAAAAAYLDAIYDIVMHSHVSLCVALLLFVVCVGLARSGGVGAVKEDTGSRPQEAMTSDKQQHASSGHFATDTSYPQPRLPVRVGGVGMQLLWGGGHALAHVSVAVILLLVLELGVEMCIRHEHLGREGLHSLFRWYQGFEAEHFPDPQGIRHLLHRVTLGLYPGAIKVAMAVFDIPEAVAVTRITVCDALGSMAGISRLQALGFYAAMLAYYWLLATPAVGAVFGLYLYVSVVWAGVHYDEAFSSLRVANHKSLTRMHITQEGDLELYTVAVDRVPASWKEDPRWKGPQGGGNPNIPAHTARFPSRWLAAWARGPSARCASHDASDDDGAKRDTSLRGGPEGLGSSAGRPHRAQGQEIEDVEWKLVDYLKIPKQRV